MPRAKRSSRFDDYEISVFVNCPFDSKYKPIFDAIVFTIIHCGFRARCALEIDDASQVRIDKIFSIIEECRFGIHDLSRTELDRDTKLPRFNMPLELGLFLGIKRVGRGIQAEKLCLILDRERFRYQKFMSDIAGQDIRAHRLRQAEAVSNTRDWLRACSMRTLPGGGAIYRQYRQFRRDLPRLCRALQLAMTEMTFNDYTNIVTEWLKTELPVADTPAAN
jgi:hypothetical protein